MEKRKLFIYVVALFFLSSISGNSQWMLVWNDEFDYVGSPDPNKWHVENVCDDGGNAELQCYTNRDTNVYVDNGVLTLRAIQESYNGKDYTSGSVVTKNIASWKYGRFEFRAKLPYSYAMWPAIWLMGINQDEVGWPRCGEIDVLEVFCDGADWDHRIISTLHWWEDTPAPGHYAAHGNNLNGLTPYNNSTPQEFHDYVLEWDESAIEMFIDGQSVFTMGITGANKSEFHEEFFMLMNVAVGGNKFPFNYPNLTSPNGSTVWPQTMEIDYVRIYSDPAGIEILGDDQVVGGQLDIEYVLPYDENNTYNWLLPAGATLTGGALDSNVVVVNWGCDSDNISCEISAYSSTFNIEKVVTVIDNNIQPDNYFVDENQTGVEFSVTEVNNGTYLWTVPDDATIVGSNTASTVTVDWGVTEGDISCLITGDCGSYTVSRAIKITGRQLPYPDPDIPHILPASIDATHYDYGGEGVAYHDSDTQNSGVNNGDAPRPDEGVDTEYGDNNNPNVGWTADGEWLEYTISVPETMTLYPEIRIASPIGNGGMNILINGENRFGTIDIPRTNDWANFEPVYLGEVTFYPTDTIIRYEIVSAGFNFSTLSFQEENPVSIPENFSKDNVNIYPVPANDQITIETDYQISKIAISDYLGRAILESDYINNTINISDLSKGIYFITLEFENKGRITKTIIKE